MKKMKKALRKQKPRIDYNVLRDKVEALLEKDDHDVAVNKRDQM